MLSWSNDKRIRTLGRANSAGLPLKSESVTPRPILDMPDM